MTTLDLIVYGGGLIAAVYLAYLATTRPTRPRRVETGAVLGWSPAQEFAASQYELTPIEMLAHQPPFASVLADGTAVVLTDQPTEEALAADTHHALDAGWEQMIAEFRTNMDAIIDKLGEPLELEAAR
jgi:hypothetical protein